MEDAFDLDRFLEAQAGIFEQAFEELRAGAKQSHWMWFVFPQMAGLGRSPTARYFAIASSAEARAYLAHPLLGPRLRSAVEAVLPWAGRRSVEQIFGEIDAIKLKSSLTLFEAVSGDALFTQAIDGFFAGQRDGRTLELIG
ncbi:MAG TPA: DUF1810 domain-containing protein [Sphingomicrobium sp.]